jgi:TolB-like protein/DNA-binding winged helix-turn-helix (wHTH) protein
MNDETGRLGPVFPIDLVGEPDFVLGASRVSPSRLEVSHAGLHETLEPRIMQVLVALYQADGKVVSRDELIARCWEGRVVGEDAITRAIGRLRRLSEADDGASFIVETIPKIGFRLVVGVSAAATEGGSAGVPPAHESSNDNLAASNLLANRWIWVGGLSLLSLAVLALAAWLLLPARSTETSVAVLPFVNLSGDPKEEYFSDGMTEEITSALAKISNLLVVGRTSAFAFKGKNEDLSAIGLALHATYLMEGSVRKAGDRVRISAQLINAATGNQVWSESYDRNLPDIFAVQEDVAKAIAAALRVPLGLNQGEALVSNRDIDPASYEDYLRAAALVRKRDAGTRLNAPIALLEGVVARQPNYAPALALLANAYSVAPQYDPAYQKGTVEELRRVAAELLAKAESAARRAIKLDPRNADAYVALGRVQGFQGKWLASEQSMKQAFSLDPLNPDALHAYGIFLAATGQIKPALAMREKLSAIDPLVPTYNVATAGILLMAGENAKALAIAQALPSGTGQRAHLLMRVYVETKRYKDAAASILSAPPGLYPPANLATAVRLLRMAPSSMPRQDGPYMGNLSLVFLYVGMPERALEEVEHGADAGFNGFSAVANIWQPDFGPARKTGQFKNLIRKLGLVDYWRARGWPQFCQPLGTSDFACN